MSTNEKIIITVHTIINAPIQKVWKCFTTPEHILNWNAASDDWHTTAVRNDLQVGGGFSYRMEAKDGSFGFDFDGIYNEIQENKLITYSIADGRNVKISFNNLGNKTEVEELFEAESENPVELQRNGWQAILDNLKQYVENNLQNIV